MKRNEQVREVMGFIERFETPSMEGDIHTIRSS